MKLIVGKLLIESKDAVKSLTTFDQFQVYLEQSGLSQETQECALVYLLRLSGNYQVVSDSVLHKFISECMKEAQSHTASGMSFPIQDELLEYSNSEEEIDSQQPSSTISRARPKHVFHEQPTLTKRFFRLKQRSI